MNSVKISTAGSKGRSPLRILLILVILLAMIMVIITISSYYKERSQTRPRWGKKRQFGQMAITQNPNSWTWGLRGGAPYELLVSAQCREYQDWQCVGLYWSMLKKWPAAIFTRLLSCTPQNRIGYKYHGIAPTVLVNDWSIHPKTGDDYAPYNRPLAITEYLSLGPPRAPYLIIIDPDTIIRKPLDDLPVSPRHPVAQRYDYLNDNSALAKIAQAYCTPDVAARVQPIGMPMIIHWTDLTQLAPLWLTLTERIRQEHKDLAGWIAEMHSYCIAAVLLGLEHEIRDDLAIRPPYIEGATDPYVLHYDIRHNCRGFTWDKRDYLNTDMLSGIQLMPEPINPPNPLFKEVFDTLNAALAQEKDTKNDNILN